MYRVKMIKKNKFILKYTIQEYKKFIFITWWKPVLDKDNCPIEFDTIDLAEKQIEFIEFIESVLKNK